MFHGTRTTPKGSTSKIYIETKEATAGLVVAYDDKPLTAAQRQGEADRVGRFLKNPEELRKKQRQELEDADRMMRILRAIPNAFLFEYAGEECGAPGIGKPGAPLVKLTFRPNPRYPPPSREEQALAGMEGTVLVDAVHHHFAQIDGTLAREVVFGWGFLGHLNKGGHLLLQQQETGNDHWRISRISLEFTGKILIVKNLNVKTTEIFSEFKPVPPDLTFAQGLELLKKEDPRAAAKYSPKRAARRGSTGR
jgi:hypothetical protein